MLVALVLVGTAGEAAAAAGRPIAGSCVIPASTSAT
jgi:hypothetical protein